MKTILTFCTLLIILSVTSCSKEDNNAPTQAAVTIGAKGSFESIVQPILAKDCANSGCHVGGGKIIPLDTKEHILFAAGNGSLGRQLFLNSDARPCVNIDESSLSILKAWYDGGSKIE